MVLSRRVQTDRSGSRKLAGLAGFGLHAEHLADRAAVLGTEGEGKGVTWSPMQIDRPSICRICKTAVEASRALSRTIVHVATSNVVGCLSRFDCETCSKSGDQHVTGVKRGDDDVQRKLWKFDAALGAV